MMLGEARGRITIDTSGLRAVGPEVQNVTRTIETNLGGVDRATKATSNNLALMATAASAAFVTGLGVSAAGRIQRINSLMEVFSGSAEKAAERMALLRSIAQRTGRSFIDLADGALAILPAVGRANIDLEKTLSLVQRLAVLDPVQGVAGASFAIRELLSGQARSLAARFELPMNKLRTLLDEAADDPVKIIEGLDRLVNEIGLTDDKFTEMGNNGIYAFERLSGTIQEALGTAFTPLLTEFLQPGANAVSELVDRLRESNPEVLKFFGLFVAGVGVLIPLSLVIKTISAAIGGLMAALSAVIGLLTSPVFLGIVGVFAAIAAAAVATTAVMQGLADRGIGDARLRSDSGESPFAVMFERLKEAVFSLVATLMGAGINLGAAFQKLEIQWQLFNVKLRLAIQAVINEVLAGLAGLIASIYELFPFLDSGGVAASGRAAQQTLTNNAEAARQTQSVVESLEGYLLRAVDKATGLAFENLDRDVLTPFMHVLFPDSAPRTDKGGTGLTSDAKGPRADGTFLERLFAPFAEPLAKLRSTAEEYVRQGTEILADYNADMARIMQDRGIADARRAADELLSDTRARRDVERQTSRSDSDFWRGMARQVSDFNAAMASDEANALAARANALADFQDEQVKRTEDHLRRLTDIERNMLMEVQEAAFRLDATGVWSAFQKGAQATAKENETYDRERAQREQEFAQQVEETKQAYAQQREERLRAFAQQQADQIAQYQLQRQRQQEDLAIQQADLAEDRRIRAEREAEDRALEDKRREDDLQDRLDQLALDLAAENSLWDGFKAGVISAAGVVRDAIADVFNEGISKAQTAQQVLAGAYAYQQQLQGAAAAMQQAYQYQQQRQWLVNNAPQPNYGGVQVISTRYGTLPPNNLPIRVPTFATGGKAMPGLAWVGERGPELVQFDQPARVYNTQESRRMAGNTSIHIEQIAPVFGDIGRHSEAKITSIVEDALYQVFAEVGMKL
jgi:hypothetical protein